MFQLVRNNLASNFGGIVQRTICTTSVARVKEIKVEKINDIIEISAEFKPSPREPLLLKEVNAPNQKFCPKCTLGLDIKHTDVLILSQYLRSDGCILPRKVTGLCATQQKNIGSMIIMAQKAGLMPNIGPAGSKRDPKKRFGWKKYNKYYDENTITYARKPINKF